MTLFKQLTEDFNNFFINKIREIRKELSDSSDNTQLLHNTEKRNIHCELSKFIPPSNKNIKDVITSFSNKTCTLDPIPTHIVKGNKFIITFYQQSRSTIHCNWSLPNFFENLTGSSETEET